MLEGLQHSEKTEGGGRLNSMVRKLVQIWCENLRNSRKRPETKKPKIAVFQPLRRAADLRLVLDSFADGSAAFLAIRMKMAIHEHKDEWKPMLEQRGLTWDNALQFVEELHSWEAVQ